MAIKYTWTKEEDEFLIKNYSTMTLKELSNCLNRRDSTISKHARDVLGLGHKKLPGLVTDIEKDYVEANYSTETYSDMAKALGVTINRICSVVMALKREKRIGSERKKLAKYSTVGQLKEIKEKLTSDIIFGELELYDIADEVEEILEVIKDKLQEGIE